MKKGGMKVLFFILIIVTLFQNNQVKTAAISDQLPQQHEGLAEGTHHHEVHQKDSEVQELESLKQPANEGQEVHIVKSHSAVIVEDGNSGKTNERVDLRDYIDENGKLVAKVHQTSEISKVPGEEPHEHTISEINIPTEGVHKIITHDSDEGAKEGLKPFQGAARLLQTSGEASPHPIQANPQNEITVNGNRRSFNGDIAQEENNNMDHFASYAGVQYSPLDMAEYIFWTGDEKAVTLAIEGLLEEGLMTREDAIGLLQEIKYNIEYLQTHYSQQKNREKIQQNALEKFNHESIQKAILEGNYERNNNLGLPLALPEMPFNIPEGNLYNKRSTDNNKLSAFNIMDQYENEPSPTVSEEEYDEILERLRIADSLHNENALENVIYHLGKMMFIQSLAQGTIEAQHALEKFTTFIKIETDKGRLSTSLEKRIINVLIVALVNALSEHPEFALMPQKDYQFAIPPQTNPLLGANSQQIALQGLPKPESFTKANRQPWIINQIKNLQMQPVKRFKMAA